MTIFSNDEEVLIKESGLSQEWQSPVTQKVPVAGIEEIIEIMMCDPSGRSCPVNDVRTDRLQ